VWPCAVFGAVITALTPWYPDIHIKLVKSEVDLTSYFQAMFLVLGFLLVVRVSLAYNRLDIANGAIYATISLLLDHQLHVCSFVRLAPGLEVDAETAQKNIEKLKWKHHMHNLLYAYASLLIAKLRGEDALLTFKDICEKYQIMLTEEEKIQLELAGHRHYSIEGLLTMLWTNMVVKGDVAVPAPFSSQTFRVSFETSDNVIRALQIVSTPYPYPLAQVQGFQQYAFMFSMPLIIGLYLKNRFLAPFITFVAIASVFGLTRLCEEMEDPFGIDANDLPLYRMLQCYRETLQTTLVSNTPSALPNVTLYVAVKKMRKTLPGDYVLKPGTPEHENMNRLCILKTGGTMDEYLQPATDVERQIEIERKRAMLENLRNMFITEGGSMGDEDNTDEQWAASHNMFSMSKRSTPSSVAQQHVNLGSRNSKTLDYTEEILQRDSRDRKNALKEDHHASSVSLSGSGEGYRAMEKGHISPDGIQLLENEHGGPVLRLNRFFDLLDTVNDKARFVRTDVSLFKSYK